MYVCMYVCMCVYVTNFMHRQTVLNIALVYACVMYVCMSLCMYVCVIILTQYQTLLHVTHAKHEDIYTHILH